MSIRTETWSGHHIRFVGVKPGDWWAVAKDIADALGYRMSSDMTRIIDQEDKGTHKVSTLGGEQIMTIISEVGIYDAIFGSHRPEAKSFKRWVFQMLKKLREASSLEGFEIFRMLDKDYQKRQMAALDRGLARAKQKHYLKANTIANKAVSNLYGYPKMLKKEQMTPEMLDKREPILKDTVDLMVAKDRFKLANLHVSKTIYQKYGDGS